MSVALSVTSTTAQQVTFGLSGTAADGTVDLQISTRFDFQFCCCPILIVARGASATIGSLNQDGTYYARARDRRASGVVSLWSPVVGFRTQHTDLRDLTPAAVQISPMALVPAEPILAWSGPALAGFPLDNLAIDAPNAAILTATGGTTVALGFQLAGQPIDTIALMNTNVPEGSVLTVTAGPTFANALGGSPAYTAVTGVQFRATAKLPVRHGYHGLVRLPAPQAYPCWVLTISGAQLPGGILYAEHLVAGLNRTSKNYTADKTETWNQLGSFERKRSGVPDRLLGLPTRHVDIDLQNLSETQYETIYADLLQYQDLRALMIPNTKSGPYLHDRMLYGAISLGKSVNTPAVHFDKSFSIDSILY